MAPFEEHFIATNGVALHVVAAGPADGPLGVLLHGFPEFWYGWRKQIPALAAAGYRVLVPDQRSYNLSDKPKGVKAYEMTNLVADIIGLIEAFGHDQAYVVGHDWGAAVAWQGSGRPWRTSLRRALRSRPRHDVAAHRRRQALHPGRPS